MSLYFFSAVFLLLSGCAWSPSSTDVIPTTSMHDDTIEHLLEQDAGGSIQDPIVSFEISELGIELLIPQSLQPHLIYEIWIEEGVSRISLMITNYRDRIPESLIPTYVQWKDQYTQAEYQQFVESSKKCFVGMLSIQQPPLPQSEIVGSIILAENGTKQVLLSGPHEPCDPYHFFDTNLDNYTGGVYDLYIEPLVVQFLNIIQNTSEVFVVIQE